MPLHDPVHEVYRPIQHGTLAAGPQDHWAGQSTVQVLQVLVQG